MNPWSSCSTTELSKPAAKSGEPQPWRTVRPRSATGSAAADFLRLGTAGLFGMGLSLPGLLAEQARRGEGQPAQDVSLIFVFLHGGLSTIDTWDLKPDAPAEFRGEFQPIATKVPGICDLRAHAAARRADGQGLADPLVPPRQLEPRPRPTTTC